MKTPLRIAILECDTPLPDVKKKYGGYGPIFKTLLEKGADALQRPDISSKTGLETTYFDVVTKQEYPNVDDIDAVLLTGSKHNSFDNDEWILKLVTFTEQLLKQNRVRVIGVCYGHQIVGRALQAPVGRSDKGWETSVALVKLTEKGQDLFGKDIMMHQDVVYQYPPHVEHLGHSPRCDVQGMYKKNSLITVQGHPEFNEEIMRELLEARHSQGIFGDDVYKDGMKRVANHHDGVVVASAFLKFLLED
ncbi:MAG: hypothetical protein Q9159_001596 [Coniocarpon cinnabarinum]